MRIFSSFISFWRSGKGIVLFILVFSWSHLACSAQKVDISFYYQGRPVRALILEKFMNKSQIGFTVDIEALSREALADDALEHDDVQHGPDGHERITTEIEYTGSFDVDWYAYDYLATLEEGVHVLLAFHKTAGTGDFTDILFLKRNGNILELVKRFAGGDRCWGGIEHAWVRGNDVFYSKRLTEKGLVEAFGLKPREGKVSDCAVCCAGTALYRNGALESVEYNEALAEKNGEREGAISPQTATATSKNLHPQNCLKTALQELNAQGFHVWKVGQDKKTWQRSLSSCVKK